MSEEPDNLVLVYLRRIDGKIDRLIEDVQDLKHRVTSLEARLPDCAAKPPASAQIWRRCLCGSIALRLASTASSDGSISYLCLRLDRTTLFRPRRYSGRVAG